MGLRLHQDGDKNANFLEEWSAVAFMRKRLKSYLVFQLVETFETV